MKFMIMMIPNSKGYEACAKPDPKVLAAMLKYNEELANAGVLLALDGLHPPSQGSRVRFEDGKKTVTDGPFAEAREVIGGYWLWQLKSKAEAIEWAKRCPASDGDVIEIRQIFDPADFAPEIVEKDGALLEKVTKRMEANAKNARG